MRVYKRSIWAMVKGIILAPFAGVAIFIALSFIFSFFKPASWQMYVQYILPVLAFLWLGYSAIFSENIRFTLNDAGILEYYNRGKLKESFDLTKVGVGYRHQRTKDLMADHYITLRFYLPDGTQKDIDCGPLGPSTFERLYSDIEKYSQPVVEEIPLTTKDK